MLWSMLWFFVEIFYLIFAYCWSHWKATVYEDERPTAGSESWLLSIIPFNIIFAFLLWMFDGYYFTYFLVSSLIGIIGARMGVQSYYDKKFQKKHKQ